MTTKQNPLIITIFGSTGDLAQKKLFPALLKLFKQGNLPADFTIIANSRRPWTHDDFRAYTKPTLFAAAASDIHDVTIDTFLSHIHYHEGVLEAGESFRTLSEAIKMIESEAGSDADLMMYLSVAPHFYETIVKHVKTHLSHRKNQTAWTRMLVEKPFGEDEQSARNLNKLLLEHFDESELFRVDHYLAKRGVHEIEALRQSDPIFEALWNKEGLERVELSLLETKTVGKRGTFYDQVGALRDVGQNHLLEALALVFAEVKGDQIKNRAHVLSNLKLFDSDISKDIVRKQYTGYLTEIGKAESGTETYFEIKAALDIERYRNIPIIIKGGKGYDLNISGIHIFFKKGADNERSGTHHFIPFSGSDDTKVATNVVEKSFYTEDGYEGLLKAGIAGDHDVFASFDEIIASWKFIDAIRAQWKSVPLGTYSEIKQ